MKVVIIENESLAAEKLTKMLLSYDQQIEVEAVIPSVEEAVDWFQKHPEPDLLLVDIRIDDGLSFEIFQKVPVKSPVIFTTAYDQYAIRAFQVHSIDYLLKPVKYEDLANSLDKLHELKNTFLQPAPQVKMDELMELIRGKKDTYKSRFLVRTGSRITAVKTEEIAYIYTHHKLNQLVTRDGKKYPVDYSLDDLSMMLDPKLFFRVNRQLITQIDAAIGIHPLFKGRIRLDLHPPLDAEVIISSKRAPAFKDWLDK